MYVIGETYVWQTTKCPLAKAKHLYIIGKIRAFLKNSGFVKNIATIPRILQNYLPVEKKIADELIVSIITLMWFFFFLYLKSNWNNHCTINIIRS